MSNDREEVIVNKLSNSSAACNVNFDASQHPQLHDFLRVEWARALQGMECLETDRWFDRLFRQHNQVGRHYHTSVHLKEMLDYLNLLEEGAAVSDQQHKAILRLAVFFHDAVYDPQSNTNEKDSSHLFEQFTREVGRICRNRGQNRPSARCRIPRHHAKGRYCARLPGFAGQNSG